MKNQKPDMSDWENPGMETDEIPSPSFAKGLKKKTVEERILIHPIAGLFKDSQEQVKPKKKNSFWDIIFFTRS